jgi:hypothetical protein
MTSSGGGSTPRARAGAESVSRLIYRIWVAQQRHGDGVAGGVEADDPGQHDAAELVFVAQMIRRCLSKQRGHRLSLGHA